MDTVGLSYSSNGVPSFAAEHMLVLFFLFLIHVRDAQTTSGRQMPEVANNTPHFLILEDSLPAGHAAHRTQSSA